MTQDVLISLAIAVAGYLSAWGMLALAHRNDRRGWIFNRAPALPVKALSEHDDAWIRGRVRTDDPLRCPWFGAACVYYSYTIERKVRRTRRTSKGKTRTETKWVTDHSEERCMPFTLVEGEVGIIVQLPRAELHDLESQGHDYETGSRRHSAEILSVGKTVSALGVRLEDGTFGPLREIPLLVTRRKRDDFLRSVARGETWARWAGLVLAFLGGGGASVFWMSRTRDVGMFGVNGWLTAVGFGLLALVPLWCVVTYNRLVRTRQQAEAAWRQVDVDMTVRDNLLPQLTAVVQGYADHERELFAAVAGLRAGGSVEGKIRNDRSASRAARGMLALRERYPELEANSLFMDLHERLWALEEKLAASRTFYNGVCEEWNRLVQGFPSIVVAKVFGHDERPFFARDEAER